MNSVPARYERNMRLFGEEGQRKLRQTEVAVMGVGGLGSPLVQHVALLGVGKVTLVDDEELDETNRNRFVGAKHDDPVPGSPKVELAARLVREINPEICVVPLIRNLVSPEAFEAVRQADWVFGCFDEDGPRFILNELCTAYDRPYVDLASDVPDGSVYGGRVCVALEGNGCLYCLNVLDLEDVHRYLATEEECAREDEVYGIRRDVLGETGPSVSPVNGVVAALGATEFMVGVTGMRVPTRLIEYRGEESKVRVSTDTPEADCIYCKGIRGNPRDAYVERYLKLSHLR